MDNGNNVSKPKKSRKTLIVILLVLALLLCSCVLFFMFLTNMVGSLDKVDNTSKLSYVSGNMFSENTILAIDIKGTILTEKVDNQSILFDMSDYIYGYSIKKIIEDAAQDPSIKAIMLEVDSPGGTVTGSKVIGDAILDYKTKTGNPVYAHIVGIAASGGYWVAASADKVFADDGTLIGNIGVIAGPFKYYKEVMAETDGLSLISTKGGVDTYYFTAGGNKDFGNSYREMTKEEKAVVDESLAYSYDQFVNYISDRRNITAEVIKNDIKALPYGEKQALDKKLIDSISSKDMAYEELIKKLGVSEYKIVKLKTLRGFWNSILSSQFNKTELKKPEKTELLKNKVLYYFGDL